MEGLLHAARPLLDPLTEIGGSPVTGAELIAVVLSLAMVGCNIRVNPTGWPLAIAASLLYFLLFWDHRLYGEAGLQVFFAVVAGWGWWQWLRGHGEDGAALRVRRLERRGRWRVAAVVLVAWPMLALLLRQATDSDVPWWDALPTTASVAGQWLLGRKYVENWPTWLGVNLVSVGLFAYKELWLTAALYALFAALSVAGWRAWERIARSHG